MSEQSVHDRLREEGLKALFDLLDGAITPDEAGIVLDMIDEGIFALCPECIEAACIGSGLSEEQVLDAMTAKLVEIHTMDDGQ